MSDYLCSSCNEDGMVCIPRAQYEALMAAANRILRSYPGNTYFGHGECACIHCEGNKAAATLRGAGIDLETKT